MISRTAVRIGSQTPTLLHLPADRADASLGDDLLELADIAGLSLDPWQERAARESVMLRRPTRRGLRPKWSAFDVVVEVARQNGKGDIKLIRQLGGLFLFGERLQVHTAHLYPTCYEHFRKLADIVDGVPDFRRHVKSITTGSQNQGIELLNGQRIRFMARSGVSGRGLSGDTVYLDEAFDLDAGQMGALYYALRARRNPQVVYASSAPHLRSIVLHALRARAASSSVDEPRLLYLGWNNDSDVDPGDVEVWYRANPALGVRVDIETMENEYRTALSDPLLLAEFRREALGIADLPGVHDLVISTEAWARCCDPQSSVPGRVAFALTCSPDRSFWSVGVAGRREDGRPHVAVFDGLDRSRWIVDVLADLVVEHKPLAVVVDPGSAAGSVITECAEKGITVVEAKGRDNAQAFGVLLDEVSRGVLAHRGQVSLSAALAVARKRRSADGESWDRTASNIASLDAVTLARWGLDNAPATEFDGSFLDLGDYLTPEGE